MPDSRNHYQMHRYRMGELVGNSTGLYGTPIGSSSGVNSGRPARVGKVSVSEMMGANQRGGPNMSMVTDPRTGTRLTNDQARARGPFTVTGGGGGGGRRGGYSGGGFRSPISSAGVAGGDSHESSWSG